MRTKFWSEILTVRDYLEDIGTDVRIILKWNLKKCNRRLWTGFN
jgi:hypothetical protein